MDLKERQLAENWTKALLFANNLAESASFNSQSFTMACSEQQQNWGNVNPSMIDSASRIDWSFSKFSQVSGNSSSFPCYSDEQGKIPSSEDFQKNLAGPSWDPKLMLNNLSFLEQKIHQLQELVHMIVMRRTAVVGCSNELVIQQQQLISADLTSIIIQLISTAGSLLPSVTNNLTSTNLLTGQLEQFSGLVAPSTVRPYTGLLSQNNENQIQENLGEIKEPNRPSKLDQGDSSQRDHMYNTIDDHELKDEDDPIEEEHLPPGSFEILQLAKEEILAPHTHFCTICGKGFKRDANLRMHMRGHGDEYKTPAALAKPHKKSSGSEPVLIRRYSCPNAGCKRNKEHKKFQPLKTILCVKNHYKRTHCDKTYTCSRCHAKKFSVIADLKTHEKHCGRDKWLCSCGTTFSRKDKLFGHIALFQGHTPAIPLEEHHKGSTSSPSNHGENSESSNINHADIGNQGFSFGSESPSGGIQGMMDGKGTMDDACFSMLGFDPCSLGGIQEVSQACFDDSASSFAFLLNGNKNAPQSDKSSLEHKGMMKMSCSDVCTRLWDTCHEGREQDMTKREQNVLFRAKKVVPGTTWINPFRSLCRILWLVRVCVRVYRPGPTPLKLLLSFHPGPSLCRGLQSRTIPH